jgi:hypothetical protein
MTTFRVADAHQQSNVTPKCAAWRASGPLNGYLVSIQSLFASGVNAKSKKRRFEPILRANQKFVVKHIRETLDRVILSFSLPADFE